MANLPPKPSWNYLRMRGEYRLFAGVFIFVSELPPHARRIPSAWACRSSIGGTTSACAENTTCIAVALAPHRNYLRMRGEYGGLGSPRLESEELPPHARRIPRPHTQRLVVPGTTSACAENTRSENHRHQCARNYLRVRGEYTITFFQTFTSLELPPRARRIP